MCKLQAHLRRYIWREKVIAATDYQRQIVRIMNWPVASNVAVAQVQLQPHVQSVVDVKLSCPFLVIYLAEEELLYFTAQANAKLHCH